MLLYFHREAVVSSQAETKKLELVSRLIVTLGITTHEKLQTDFFEFQKRSPDSTV
jgi:hypothetical protein